MMTSQNDTSPTYSYVNEYDSYDALPARAQDRDSDVPARASHTVFRGDGSLAGYVISPHRHGTDCARQTRGTCALFVASMIDGAIAGHACTLDSAVRMIAGSDYDD